MAIVGVDSEGIDMSGVNSGGSGIDIVESGQCVCVWEGYIVSIVSALFSG